MITEKKLVVFDLDCTLAESKQPIDVEMSDLLEALLQKRQVAVIGGGSYAQFHDQFVSMFTCPDDVKSRLLLFPTCGARCFAFNPGGLVQEVYSYLLGDHEKSRIMAAFDDAFGAVGWWPADVGFGPVIEDRGTQITFSALGQQAPLADKQAWNASSSRLRVWVYGELCSRLPDFEVRMGGLTSIDVTRKGIDKAYGMRQIEKMTSIPIADMVFVGDALYEGGNDYPVRATGVDCISTSGPTETKVIIRRMLGWDGMP